MTNPASFGSKPYWKFPTFTHLRSSKPKVKAIPSPSPYHSSYSKQGYYNRLTPFEYHIVNLFDAFYSTIRMLMLYW